ncbi:MAG: hypothetical protein Kow0059_18180 [Candidatus Sumerlaeia bacterium]
MSARRIRIPSHLSFAHTIGNFTGSESTMPVIRQRGLWLAPAAGGGRSAGIPPVSLRLPSFDPGVTECVNAGADGRGRAKG